MTPRMTAEEEAEIRKLADSKWWAQFTTEWYATTVQTLLAELDATRSDLEVSEADCRDLEGQIVDEREAVATLERQRAAAYKQQSAPTSVPEDSDEPDDLGEPDQCGLIDPKDPTSPVCNLAPNHEGRHRRWFHGTVEIPEIEKATPDEQADRDEYLATIAEKRKVIDAALTEIKQRMTAARLSTWQFVYSWAHPHGDEDEKNLHEKRLAFLDRARQDIPFLLDALASAVATGDALTIHRDAFVDLIRDIQSGKRVRVTLDHTK